MEIKGKVLKKWDEVWNFSQGAAGVEKLGEIFAMQLISIELTWPNSKTLNNKWRYGQRLFKSENF